MQLLLGLSRTNNSVEGHHSIFNSLFADPHGPRVSRVLEKIFEEDSRWKQIVEEYRVHQQTGSEARELTVSRFMSTMMPTLFGCMETKRSSGCNTPTNIYSQLPIIFNFSRLIPLPLVILTRILSI